MKNLIIAIVILLIITVGGFFVYYFIKNDTSPATIIKDANFFPLSGLRSDNDNSLLPGSTDIASDQPGSIADFSDDISVSNLILFKDNIGDNILVVDQTDGSVQLISPSGETEKIKLPTAAGVYESYITKKDDHFYIIRRTLDNFTTIRNTLTSFKTNPTNETTSQSEKELNETLIGDITSISVAPTQDQFFILEKFNDGLRGYTTKADLSGKKQIFESPLAIWQADWFNKNLIALQTKTSRFMPGSLYVLNITTGEMEKVLSGVLGLSAKWSPDSKKIIYSSITEGKLRLNLYERESKVSTKLPLATMAEKCAWTEDSVKVFCAVPNNLEDSLPDSWYQGEFTAEDSLWEINTVNAQVKTIFNLPSLGSIVDINQMVIGKDGSKIYFINRNNQSMQTITL